MSPGCSGSKSSTRPCSTRACATPRARGSARSRSWFPRSRSHSGSAATSCRRSTREPFCSRPTSARGVARGGRPLNHRVEECCVSSPKRRTWCGAPAAPNAPKTRCPTRSPTCSSCCGETATARSRSSRRRCASASSAYGCIDAVHDAARDANRRGARRHAADSPCASSAGPRRARAARRRARATIEASTGSPTCAPSRSAGFRSCGSPSTAPRPRASG